MANKFPIVPANNDALTFLEAVAREEGWLDSDSRCRRNNNPGNIEAGKFASAHGATEGGDSRFAVFPSAAAGFGAMLALFKGPAYRALTVAEAIERWAPSVENNTQLYVANVCKWAGCLPTDSIDALLSRVV